MIHGFGRTDQVDWEAPARPVSSISRYLPPEQQDAAAAVTLGGGADAAEGVEVVQSRRMGGARVLDVSRTVLA